MDPLSGDRHVDHFSAAEFLDLEDYCSPGFALHLVAGLGCFESVGRRSVDLEDFISAYESGARRRGAGVWFIDYYIAVLLRFVDYSSDSSVGLSDHHLEVFLVLFRNIDRIRVESFEHGVDAGLLHASDREAVYVSPSEFAEDGVMDLDPLAEFEIFRLSED